MTINKENCEASAKILHKQLSDQYGNKIVTVGVGLSADGLLPAIYVFLLNKSIIKKIPVSFEEFEVRTVVTGKVRPL